MFATVRRVVFAAATAALVSLSGQTAQAVIIDFDGFFPGLFVAGVEDGFSIVNTAPGSLDVSPGFIPPVSAPHHIHHFTAGATTVVITDTAPGGLFTFGSLFAGGAFGGADPLFVDGYLGGILVGSDVFAPPLGAHASFAAIGLAGVTIDALHIGFGPALLGPTHVDDILLTRVPEPAAIGLFGLGLVGLGLAMRRRRTH